MELKDIDDVWLKDWLTRLIFTRPLYPGDRGRYTFPLGYHANITLSTRREGMEYYNGGCYITNPDTCAHSYSSHIWFTDKNSKYSERDMRRTINEVCSLIREGLTREDISRFIACVSVHYPQMASEFSKVSLSNMVRPGETLVGTVDIETAVNDLAETEISPAMASLAVRLLRLAGDIVSAVRRFREPAKKNIEIPVSKILEIREEPKPRRM